MASEGWHVRIFTDLKRGNLVGALAYISCWGSDWYEKRNGRTGTTQGEEYAQQGRKLDNQYMDMELLKIQVEIDQRLKCLEFEPVFDLEKEYVVVKKDIFPPRLQEQIERSLLLYRDCTGHLLEIERRFVNCALNLPRSPRKIIRVDHRRDDLAGIINNVRAAFSTFRQKL